MACPAPGGGGAVSHNASLQRQRLRSPHLGLLHSTARLENLQASPSFLRLDLPRFFWRFRCPSPTLLLPERLSCVRSQAGAGQRLADATLPSGTTAAVSQGIEHAELNSRIMKAATSGSLDLSGCGLAEVPRIIFEMDELVDLNLAGNTITSLPEAIGKLTSLRRLGLAGNRLRQLPASIGQLTYLQGLWLHSNLLQEVPSEIGRLLRLRILDLDGNLLEQLPSTIGDLCSLQMLDISHYSILPTYRHYLWPATDFVNYHKTEIGELSQLKVLSAFGNRLCSLPDSICSLTSLSELWLQGNDLKSLPEDLSRLSQLSQLSLADNDLATLPNSMGKLPMIESMWLYGNKLQEVPQFMPNHKKLKYIWLESNPLQTNWLQNAIPSFSNLKAIGVDSEQAQFLREDVILQAKNYLIVSPIAGTGAARHSGGYFKIQPWESFAKIQAEDVPFAKASVLVVAFGSAPGVPNWAGLLKKVRAHMKDDNVVPAFDTLYVVDPARSWYSASSRTLARQGGNNSTLRDIGALQGDGITEYSEDTRRESKDTAGLETAGRPGIFCEYYRTEISEIVKEYDKVDHTTSSLKPGREQAWQMQYHDQIMQAVATSEADITVHCGNWLHDQAQAQLLPAHRVNIVVHEVEDHRLAKELDRSGVLVTILMEKLGRELSAASSSQQPPPHATAQPY
eukprot:SM000071S21095  [mRNA]  locus=s71:323765:328953:- [translate_table: standard]